MKKNNKNQFKQNNGNSNNFSNKNSHNNKNKLNNNHNNYQSNSQNNTNYNIWNNNGIQFIEDSRYTNNTNHNSNNNIKDNNNMNINNSNSNTYQKNNIKYNNVINNRNNNQSNRNNFVPFSATTFTYNVPQVNNHNINNNLNITHNAYNYNHFNISSFALSSNAMNNYEIIPENPNIRSKVDLTNSNYNNVLNQLPENTIEDLNKLNEENKSCIICLSEYQKGDTTIVLPCFHFFHKNCMINWYKRKAGGGCERETHSKAYRQRNGAGPLHADDDRSDGEDLPALGEAVSGGRSGDRRDARGCKSRQCRPCRQDGLVRVGGRGP